MIEYNDKNSQANNMERCEDIHRLETYQIDIPRRHMETYGDIPRRHDMSRHTTTTYGDINVVMHTPSEKGTQKLRIYKWE